MFNHRLDQTPHLRVILHWFLLTFNAGSINAGGFLATGRFVSHVTGFATLFGVDLFNRELDAAIGILSVPFFFLLGAFLAGLFIDRPLHRGKKPHFDFVMGLASFCLFLAFLGGEFSQFGAFGAGFFKLKQGYLLLALLCLACGLQNGAITSSSGSSVRTTHLTGLTTDLGLGLARLLSTDPKRAIFKKEVRANRLRCGSIIAFILGSAVGSWFFMKYGYRGFILSATLSAYMAWQGRKEKIKAHPETFLEEPVA